MPDAPPASDAVGLEERLALLGHRIGEREADHAEGLSAARKCLAGLRARVAGALEGFHAAAARAGAPHLRVELSELRCDDKHLRAIEFDLTRGRHKAIVTARSRGEVTLVGPFHAGKAEGPCRSFPIGAGDELERALAGFLESFLEQAATP
jgi:hypothetical protein